MALPIGFYGSLQWIGWLSLLDEVALNHWNTQLTIHNWERGIATPTPENIKVICTYCNVTPDFLIIPEVEYELNPSGLDDEGYELLQNLIYYFEKK